jgi:hypothetical protein
LRTDQRRFRQDEGPQPALGGQAQQGRARGARPALLAHLRRDPPQRLRRRVTGARQLGVGLAVEAPDADLQPGDTVLDHHAGHLEPEHLPHQAAELGHHVAPRLTQHGGPQLELGVERGDRRQRLGLGSLEAPTDHAPDLGHRLGEGGCPPGQQAGGVLDHEGHGGGGGPPRPGQSGAEGARRRLVDEDPGPAAAHEGGAAGEGAGLEPLGGPDEGPQLGGEEGGATLGVGAGSLRYEPDRLRRSP